ncbi:MAG: hypothetical protein KAG95_00365 [Bacteroidales bacterium]|nr:hypothetical protein [Bacteroidales bacterium]
MDKKKLIKNINKDIKEIENIVTSFNNNSEIHQIDVDNTLSKIRNLYDKVLMFNDIKDSFEKKISKNIEENLKITDELEINTEDKLKIEDNVEDIKKTKKVIVKRTKEITDDNVEDFTLQPHKNNQDIVEKKQKKNEEIKNDTILEEEKKPTNKKKEVNNIVADSFASNQKSINEKIAGNRKFKDLATKLQDKPVSDINKIISLNEKIQFIQILFKGDSQLYKKTIDAVNSFDNTEMVIDFFNQNFDWDKNNKHYISFIELISRRFL